MISNNIALAALETLTPARAAGVPLTRYLVRFDIPAAVRDQRLELSAPPGGWDALPCGMTSKATGDAWVHEAPSAVLLVPSVIIPDEFNILINPGHPQARSIVALTVKRFAFDPRFFAA
jgi:RES domain-containing protein